MAMFQVWFRIAIPFLIYHEFPFALNSSLADLALSAGHHGVDGADHFFLGGELSFGGCCGGGGGGLEGHVAALDFLDVDGGFLGVGGVEGAEVVGGLEALVPCTAVNVAEGLEVRGGEEEIDRL